MSNLNKIIDSLAPKGEEVDEYLKAQGYDVDELKENGTKLIKGLAKREKDKKALGRLLYDVILKDPMSKEAQWITDVRADEKGLVIETEGMTTKWKHTFETEEM